MASTLLKDNSTYSYKTESKALIELLTGNNSQTSLAFEKTLANLKADRFLIEPNYVDKDYLEDYANFYARCFQDYNRFCKRLHFFKGNNKRGEKFSFSNRLLKKIWTEGLDDKTLYSLQDNYLGFIVLKPAKNGFMLGRTCIRHYEEDEERNRRYHAKRDYSVNLYGIELKVQSMAFQEQDETVAVCASIALWSAFNITGKRFQHRIPSPSEVTKLALSETSYMRSFPSIGLSQQQMGVAVSKLGLNPLLVGLKQHRNIKSHIYAYLKAGIPLICGLSLYNELEKDGKVVIDENSKSYHAVTINGFSFEGGEGELPMSDGLRLLTSRMTQFYVHDDQLCPFTKMEFDNSYCKIGESTGQKVSTTWHAPKPTAKKKYKEHKVAIIEGLIIPLYHKIRISYHDILDEVQGFSSKLDLLMKELSTLTGSDFQYFEWEIFLTEVGDFKKDILSQPDVIDREKILKKGYAKYLWRARAITIGWLDTDSRNRKTELELIFDATDSKKKGISKEIIYYNPIIKMGADFYPKILI
ncbi:MAG: hypothetical protein BGO31_16980 [Bacteroidetes bacterium 43-16]|nr:MAG: hypothetical protein BGO31_16980 [Bacteroidetes bacterium 43-16]